jgi:hypothetical protein
MGIIRQAIIAIAADSYNLPYRIVLDGSGILLRKSNEVD